ncbi:hypothetical protein CLF_108015 [Clonorchis sinensis]|uniref:Uncharacterized protein n=1 Tax=Clonorchis sinensis TaxID=79923 RepID=G7YHI4_CLOSI|nr:hypothetical protein CLF_108015 [Clonorchis sinensis]
MDCAAAKKALAAEFDTTADRQEALLSDQFVEGVQPALGAQLRLARATGQLSVEYLVHLARELAEAPLATFQSQENRQDSTVEDLENKVDQLTEQLAAVKTESGGTLERADATSVACLATGEINALVPDHLYIIKFWSTPLFPGDKSVQHTFLISPDIEQTILGADFLKSTDSAIDLKQGKLVTSYGAVKLEGYPSTANAFDLTAPVHCRSIYGRRSINTFKKRNADLREDVLLTCLISSIHRYTSIVWTPCTPKCLTYLNTNNRISPIVYLFSVKSDADFGADATQLASIAKRNPLNFGLTSQEGFRIDRKRGSPNGSSKLRCPKFCHFQIRSLWLEIQVRSCETVSVDLVTGTREEQG